MEIKRSYLFLLCCVVFIIGVAIASFASPHGDLFWFFLINIALVATLLFWHNKKVKVAILMGLFLFLGIWRYQISLPSPGADKIWHYNGQEASFLAVVADEPDVRSNNIKYEINTEAKLEFRSLDPVNGKVLVTSGLYPRYQYGDKLEVNCRLEKPEKFEAFAYDRYLARYDIYSVCYWPEIKLISSEGNWFYSKILILKNKLRQLINAGLPEPESSLASAIILGDKRGLPADLKDNFAKTGLSHITAISGMHITILSTMIMMLLIFIGLWRRQAFYAATIFLIFYIILIGAPASAVRAGVMGFLVLLALHLGRLSKLFYSLTFAAAVLLLFNPKLLRDDIGFQLSFLAVAGISYAYQPLNAYFSRLINNPKLKTITGILAVTLAAQLFTLPIIAYNFGRVSLIAPVANLAVILTLPFLMITILTGLSLSSLLPFSAALNFFPAYLILKYIIFIANFLSAIPLSFIDIR